MTRHVDKVANLQVGRLVWVGGRLTIDDHTVEFHPNGANRELHHGPNDVVVPLEEIERVDVAPGLVTRKIKVTGRRGVVVVRCFGAGKVAATLRRLTGIA